VGAATQALVPVTHGSRIIALGYGASNDVAMISAGSLLWTIVY